MISTVTNQTTSAIACDSNIASLTYKSAVLILFSESVAVAVAQALTSLNLVKPYKLPGYPVEHNLPQLEQWYRGWRYVRTANFAEAEQIKKVLLSLLEINNHE